MTIDNDREVKVFDHAYRLGFRAGQLDWRRQMIANAQRTEAYMGGVQIALFRNNLDVEEYTRIVEAGEPEYLKGGRNVQTL